MALKLGELVAVISADDSGFRRVLGRVHSGLQAVGKVGSLAALAGSAAHLGVALAPAAGIVAVLPGAFIAAKVASAALGLALDGVSEAVGSAISGDLKEFNKQLQGMPPAMRGVVRELGGAFFGLKATAQNAFFAPMRKEARGFGQELRVPIGRGIATITASMGRFGAQVLGVAREGRSLSFMKNLSLAIAKGIDGAAKGVKPLIRGIRDFAGASLGGFGRAGNAMGRLMAATGRWLSRMGRGGQATRWIHGGVTALKTLGRIGRNVALTVGAIFKNAGAGASTGGLLTTIEQASGAMLAWAQSAEGQEKIAGFFTVLNDTAEHLVTILPLLVGPLGAVVRLIQLLPGPSQGTATQFLSWGLAVGFLYTRLAPLAKALAPVGKAVGVVGKGVGKGFRGLAGHLRNADSVTRRAASRMGSAFATAARGAGRLALSVGRAAGSMALSGLKMAGSAALAAARTVGSWVVMGTQALIQGAKAALFWILANWPIVLLVAAIIGAVYLIIKHWDKIVTFFTKTLPHWIKVGFDWIIGIVKKGAELGFFGPVGLIISHWDKISKFFTQTLPKAISNGIDNVVGWIRRLPGWVVSAVGDTGKLLVNAGKNILYGLWNGIASVGSWLQRSLINLVTRIVPGPVARILGIHSPSTVFAGFGENLAQGLAQGMTGGAGLVSDAAGVLAGAAAGGGAAGLKRPGAGRSASGGAGAAVAVRSQVDIVFTGAESAFLAFMRKIVRTKGQGSVQVAFGTSRG